MEALTCILQVGTSAEPFSPFFVCQHGDTGSEWGGGIPAPTARKRDKDDDSRNKDGNSQIPIPSNFGCCGVVEKVGPRVDETRACVQAARRAVAPRPPFGAMPAGPGPRYGKVGSLHGTKLQVDRAVAGGS